MTIEEVIKFCSECAQPISDWEVPSCNTFSSRMWTDGTGAFTLHFVEPRESLYAICPHCGAYVWLHQLEQDNTCSEKEIPEKYPEAIYFKAPSIEEYLEELAEKKFTKEEEKYLRRHLWHMFDDPRRDEDRPIIPMSDIEKDNLEVLLPLLDDTNPHDLLTKVEVFRQLGRFTEAETALSQVPPGRFDNIIRQMGDLIRDENVYVQLMD